jgi:hypothetical protein
MPVALDVHRARTNGNAEEIGVDGENGVECLRTKFGVPKRGIS